LARFFTAPASVPDQGQRQGDLDDYITIGLAPWELEMLVKVGRWLTFKPLRNSLFKGSPVGPSL
jgi:hypothetical protein